MKEKVFIFLLVAVLILPLISSIEIQMPSEIPQGQTVIAKVEGNFLDPILKENIEFYRGEIKTSFNYDVGKINGIYYIYFQTLGKNQNNYSISVKDARYYVGAQISNEAFSKNFSVTSESADFYINKGFVISDGNFSITVQNLNPGSITISITTEVSSGSSNGFFDLFFKSNQVQDSINLLSGETEEIEISIENISETTTRTITLSSENTKYEILAYVIAQSYPETEDSNESTTSDDNEDNETFYEEKNESSDDNKGSFWDFFKKKEESTEDNSSKEDGNGKETGNEINYPSSSKTCSELKGVVCSSSQICQNDNITYARNSTCCLSSCVKKPASKNSKIIGWALIGLIIILLIWFRIKFNKTRKRKFSLPK